MTSQVELQIKKHFECMGKLTVTVIDENFVSEVDFYTAEDAIRYIQNLERFNTVYL